MFLLIAGLLLGVTFTVALLGLTRASADHAADLTSAGTLGNIVPGDQALNFSSGAGRR